MPLSSQYKQYDITLQNRGREFIKHTRISGSQAGLRYAVYANAVITDAVNVYSNEKEPADVG